MTPAEQYLKEAKLAEALSELQNQIRNDPANSKLRVFLFQLLCVLGQWDKALNQLNVLRDMDNTTLAMVQVYQEALNCEALRAEIFSGKRRPIIFGKPENWMAKFIDALRVGAEGEQAKSQELREESLESAATSSGQIGDTRFEWIADADSRIGPFLEAIINGNYYWIPFERIHQITIEQPEDLRDVVWTPMQLTLANGGEVVGLIPTRYPESHNSEDDKIRLASKTVWENAGSDVYCGLGQRVFTTDAEEYVISELKTIILDNKDDLSEKNLNQEEGAIEG